MSTTGRPTEFFGPNLTRGPNIAGNPEVSAIQIATTLAQVRAPLTRNDDDLRDHVQFIRELADRLMPDWAVQVGTDVGGINLDREIITTIRSPNGSPTLLHVWLAAGFGGGLTDQVTQTVTFDAATAVIHEFVANTHYLVLTPDTGVVTATVQNPFQASFRWAVARNGRVQYSSELIFPA